MTSLQHDRRLLVERFVSIRYALRLTVGAETTSTVTGRSPTTSPMSLPDSPLWSLQTAWTVSRSQLTATLILSDRFERNERGCDRDVAEVLHT
jgi:hypothetical protein